MVINASEFDKMGYYHNIVLQNIHTKYGSDFIDTADSDVYFNAILEEIGNLGYDLTEFNKNSAKYNAVFNEMMNTLQTEGIDAMDDLILRYNPNMANEVNLIVNSYLDTYSNIATEFVPDYSVNFRNIVTSSNIPSSSKQVLQSAVSIGVGSTALWNVN